MLYLSLDVMTAVGECTQGLSQRLRPLTMCEYDIDCDPIADLRTETDRSAAGVAIDDLSCAWLEFLRQGKEAPSWRVADQLKVAGNAGMLAPSFFPGAAPTNCNLILWRWGPDLPTQVTVFDPSGRLPKNQLSWS